VPHRIRIKQRSATSWLRRLRYRLSRLAGARLQKSQRIYVVEINGHRFKRTIQPDSYTAECIERSLEAFAESDRLPGVAIQYERELWVEFIDGERLKSADGEVVRAVAELFSILHRNNPRLVATDETRFGTRLRRSLRFLHRVGVLNADVYADLREAAQRLQPTSVWVGYEYTDAILKNFIVAADDGRTCAIDVESLAADELIGMGYAKASQFWLGEYKAEFLEHLSGHGGPDFRPYLPFVELYFLSQWMQRAFIEQKWRFVDASRFEPFRGPSDRDAQSVR